jgi:hypothetical protein
MTKSRIESAADKIEELLADASLSAADWKVWIPGRITQNNMAIIANAKNLADGINEEIARSEIVIPKELLFDYQTDGESEIK